MNFFLDIIFSSMQEVISTLLSSFFLVPLTIFSETVIQAFTGGGG
jgi:hypothetical protein